MVINIYRVTTNGMTLHVDVLQQTNMVTVLHTTLVTIPTVLFTHGMLHIMLEVAVVAQMAQEPMLLHKEVQVIMVAQVAQVVEPMDFVVETAVGVVEHKALEQTAQFQQVVVQL
jgi:hypothetical protein